MAEIQQEVVGDPQIDQVAKEWIQDQVDHEVKRVRDAGSSVLPFKLINCGVVPNFEKKTARAINRLELDTNVDLSKVEQVMVSPAVPYPHKQDFLYVNLILVKLGQPIPFLAPYLYQTNVKVMQPEKEQEGRKTIPSKEVTLKNDLREFLFINKRGARARFTIHEYHGGILNRQFEASRFASEVGRQPTELAIFDFDSTLFYSPLLSPTLWHTTLVHAITTENLLGPGWWRDIRSLELGDQVEAGGWSEFWNPHVVKRARQAIADPDVLSVVLTGRRVHPFQRVLPRMLASQQLDFDMVCMRPDPELEYGPSVFSSTMDFKQAYIINMLRRVPSVKRVVMWDDRIHHVKRFKTFLQKLHLHSSQVNYVHAIRPKYNPEWERQVVSSIVEGSPYTLVPMVASTVIVLDPESAKRLKALFPYTLRDRSGEVPVYFGDKVLLAPKDLPKDKVPLGGIGARVDVKVQSVSCFKAAHGFQLLVSVSKANENNFSKETYPLPMYFKPSEKPTLTRLTDWDWSPSRVNIVVEGRVDYGYLQGIETLRKPGKRFHD
ncbi:hypothetical protein BJV82DRAFT_518261 [Fennellomyces sp. T-0311]|nr:hypothetical protein BJV82DRAFT_518261 [Fennellomyces sp. T-0311]